MNYCTTNGANGDAFGGDGDNVGDDSSNYYNLHGVFYYQTPFVPCLSVF